jgi:hypothetical protein
MSGMRLCALLMMAGGTAMLAAQTPAPQPPSTAAAAHKPAHSRTRPSAAHPTAKPAPEPPAPVTPPTPPPPDWPVLNQPSPATITWDSHGLQIQAQNSSLQQILADVATATGAKVEGLGNDERVFGAYGPGQAKDVLSQLLQGSGYNVLMAGDLGQGAPRRIILSARHSGGASRAPNAAPQDNGEDDAGDNTEVEEQQPPPPQPAVNQPGFGPGGPARTPQQVMEEMQRRQMQQQQQQPGSPGTVPPNQQ